MASKDRLVETGSLINFADGVATPETQAKLNQLLTQISEEEIETVKEYCYKLLAKAGKEFGKKYRVSYVPIIPLQLMLGNNTDIVQYGVHSGNIIKIVKMGDSKKGRFGEALILAHETGHALLGAKNFLFREKWGTRVMEKATDEVIKMYLMNRFPTFYQMYVLCRDTHHYKTKEGDYKEFFKDIISKMERQWKKFKGGVKNA